MTRILLNALALLAIPACTATPAAAQTVAGCGATAIAKADQSNATRLAKQADCFGKVKTIATTAETARRARIEAIKPAPAPSPTPDPVPTPVPAQAWKDCAGEGERCAFIGEARVRYGEGDRTVTKVFFSGTQCGNQVFGDPAPNRAKRCSWQPTDGTEPVAIDPNGPPKLIPAGVRAWPLPAKPTTPRGLLGINVAAPGAWWSGDQTYVNLMRGAEWRAPGWGYVTRADLRPDGLPRAERVGDDFHPLAIIKPPLGSQQRDVPVVCTWEGTGQFLLEGNAHRDVSGSARQINLTFWANADYSKFTWLRIVKDSPADPIRNLDCRAVADVGIRGLFLPEVLAYYRQFGTLRFLDASGVNGNGAWRWASRTLPDDITMSGSDGMPLEHQVALAAEAGSDGWYNVSWNADEDYQRRMAQLIHDATPAHRRVYVELANEVWNFSFGVASQARTEGHALDLSGDGDGFKSGLLLYAQKTAALMRIWTEVFADRPGQLIRVIGTQQDNPWVSGVVMAESGLGRSGLIDALAGAPYFGGAVSAANPNLTDMDRLFPLLKADMDRVIDVIQPQNAAIAKQYGAWSISYEAGQHLVSENVEMVAAANRDARMGELYRDYIPRAIAANDGNLVVLFSATGPISKFGAWGLREYAGQPLAETPKRQAVEAFLGR